MGLGIQQDLAGMLGQKTGWRGCGGVARAGLSSGVARAGLSGGVARAGYVKQRWRPASRKPK